MKRGLSLSVITPTLNSLRFIEACCENVMGQGEVVSEHIIADGGSTDGTAEWLDRAKDRHPHIKYLPGPDRGQSDALNKATELATGDVIGILNVDDYYEAGAAEEALGYLEKMRGPGIVCGDCRVIDERGELIVWNRPKNLKLDMLLLGGKYTEHPYNPSSYFYHRAVHSIVGGYDVSEHYAMDLDFILSAARLVETAYVPSHWGNFRLMKGGKTHDDDQTEERAKRVINQHLSQLPLWRRVRIRLLQARIDALKRRRRLGDIRGLVA